MIRKTLFPRKLCSPRCGPASLVGLALLLALVTGVMADLPGGLFRPVSIFPFRDRPARLIPIRGLGFVTGELSDLVALAVVFEGQTLRVESSNLQIDPPLSGTIADFLRSEGPAIRWATSSPARSGSISASSNQTEEFFCRE